MPNIFNDFILPAHFLSNLIIYFLIYSDIIVFDQNKHSIVEWKKNFKNLKVARLSKRDQKKNKKIVKKWR